MKEMSVKIACNAVETAALQARHLVSINGDPVPRKKSLSRGTSGTSVHDTSNIFMKASNSLHENFSSAQKSRSRKQVAILIYCGKKREEISGRLILVTIIIQLISADFHGK